MTIATATEMQNNFGKYLSAVMNGEEVTIIKNGKEVARMISKQTTVSFLTDALRGVLSGDYDDKAAKTERYENQ